MPTRRPSASTKGGGGTLHKSSESNQVSTATLPLSMSTTPQHKVVQILVGRLKQKLPYYSGDPLERLEADDAVLQVIESLVELTDDHLDVIALALCELLDRLAKLVDPASPPTIQVLQSQLFVLKVLALAMASRWDHPVTDPNSPKWAEPAPLDENCARYILSVMILFLRQTADPDVPLMLPVKNTDISFRDFASVDTMAASEGKSKPSYANASSATLRNQASFASGASTASSGSSPNPILFREGDDGRLCYQATHMSLLRTSVSLNSLISRSTSQIIFHISASNWKVVIHRIRTRIHHLCQASEENPEILDLQLITNCALDKARLIQLLAELSSRLLDIKQEVRIAIMPIFRQAIWNWIDIFPSEFSEAIRVRGKLDGAPERLFDLFYTSVNQSGLERVSWPMLTLLYAISPERLKPELNPIELGKPNYKAKKEFKFGDEIFRHARPSSRSRLAEISLVCGLDICRAATYIADGDANIRQLAHDIAAEIRNTLVPTTTASSSNGLASAPGVGSGSARPYWEMSDDLDVGICADALCAVWRFCNEDEALRVFLALLEPERSDALKSSVARACLTLVQDTPRFPLLRSYMPLAFNLAPRLRAIFHVTAIRQSEIDSYGNQKRSSTRPKLRRTSLYPLPDRELLLLSILSLWRSEHLFYFPSVSEKEVQSFFVDGIKVWEQEGVDWSIKISIGVTMKSALINTLRPSTTEIEELAKVMATSLPNVLSALARNIIYCRTNKDQQRLWLMYLIQLLEVYSLKPEDPHAKGIIYSPTRIGALAMVEIALIITLTSPEPATAQLAGRALRMISHAERDPQAPPNPALSEDELSTRHPVFETLGDPRTFAVMGRLGLQKKIRKMLKMSALTHAVTVGVWQEGWYRWKEVSEKLVGALEGRPDVPIARRGDVQAYFQDLRFQWQHLTLFLATLCGPLITSTPSGTSSPAPPSSMSTLLHQLIPPRLLPDHLRVLQDSSTLIFRFISELTDLLVAEDVQLREIARDALGLELSPKLYGRLINYLDNVIHDIEEGVGQDLTDTYSLFLDQFITVLSLLLDNPEVTIEDLVGIDLYAMMVPLTSFVSRFATSIPIRTRIRFCSLAEGIATKMEMVNLGSGGWDNAGCLIVVDLLIDWILPTVHMDREQAAQHSELNMSCLKTTVKLLHRLQLKPQDGTAGAAGEDSSHVVSRLFNKYSSALLQTLEMAGWEGGFTKPDSTSEQGSIQQRMKQSQREADLRELVITGLANLVSANTEAGFKHCLPLAYDPDPRKKVIFAHVFARVMGEGTKFHPEETSRDGQARHSRLHDLVKGSEMVLTLAICETCQAHEVDQMTSVLLNVFDTRSSLLTLLKLMIDREISHTAKDTALFRGNSFYNRFLSTFARIHGYNYLRNLIIPLLKSMENSQGSYELDPSKVGEEEAKANRKNVEIIAAAFLEIIQYSLNAMPSMIREVCAHIAQAVYDVWPDSKFASLGAFIFLRFISPVVVQPELVDLDIPKDHDLTIRRGLMVIAKVIQNLANNIFFGKEAYMMPLNEFLKANIANVTRFLSELHKHTPVDGEESEKLGTSSDETDMIVLHRFFVKYADKIGKELLSSAKPQDGDQAAADGKRAWDGLCTLLVDLGPPMETPRPSNLTSDRHPEFQELLARSVNRNMESVAHIFVECSVPETENALFVLRVSQIDVEALDVNLAMAHIGMALTAPRLQHRNYEIIVDLTSFSQRSEVPLQWFKYCIELIPADVQARLVATHVLNPNALSLKFLRRVYNISAGVMSLGTIRVNSCIRELLQDVPDASLENLRHPLSLEQEESELFDDVTLKEHHFSTPIHLLVGKSHIRLTHVKTQQITTGVSCRATEIIPLGDVSDIYGVSTGVDHHEFIIRRTRQGGTIYFTSPAREAIVKAIRTAKGSMKEPYIPLTDRFSRFSNVPATLLHVGLLNLDPNDEEVRGAAYSLLGALCTYLNYDKCTVVATKAGFVPGDPVVFASQFSQNIADVAPHLALDFISEVSAGMQSMDREAFAERVKCLQYLSPWVKNLSLFADPLNSLFEKSGSRVRDCIRVLCEISVTFPELAATMQQCIWSEVAKLDCPVMDTIVDELIRAAADGGVGTRRCESVCLIMASLSSIHVRSRVVTKLRKALNKTAPRQFKSFTEVPNWNEVATLIRLVLASGHELRHIANNQIFVPEIVHLIALVAGVGTSLIRKSTYGILINLLQALWSTHTDENMTVELSRLIIDAQSPGVLKMFGLIRPSVTSEYSLYDPPNDRGYIESQEELTRFLLKVMSVTSGSQGLLNIWRARWMSLVTSTAFQLTPAIQTRSFTVIGILATSDVDEDFIYQMLVAFKTAMQQTPENDTITVVAMLRCIIRVVPALPEQSRYPCQLFWLGVALLQSSYFAFFPEAAQLVRVTLEVMDSRPDITNDPEWMEGYLWAGRDTLEDISSQLDQLLGLSFEPVSGMMHSGIMGWSLAALLVKGLRQPVLVGLTSEVLHALLRVTVTLHLAQHTDLTETEFTVIPPPAIPFFIALVPTSITTTKYRELLEECHVDASMYLPPKDDLDEAAENAIPPISAMVLGLAEGTTALFAASLIGSMLSTAQGDDAETDMLFALLSDIANHFPEVVGMIYDSLQDRITKTFGTSSNASILRSVSSLFRSANNGSLDTPITKNHSGSTLGTIPEDQGPSVRHLNALDEYGMPGLATPLTFVGTNTDTSRKSWEACINGIIPELTQALIM